MSEKVRTQLRLVTGPNWRRYARCLRSDPVIFFKNADESQEQRRTNKKQALQTCMGCAAVDSCLLWALHQDVEHGTWGAMTNTERRRALKRPEVQQLLTEMPPDRPNHEKLNLIRGYGNAKPVPPLVAQPAVPNPRQSPEQPAPVGENSLT